MLTLASTMLTLASTIMLTLESTRWIDRIYGKIASDEIFAVIRQELFQFLMLGGGSHFLFELESLGLFASRSHLGYFHLGALLLCVHVGRGESTLFRGGRGDDCQE